MKLVNVYGCELTFESLDRDFEIDMSIESTNSQATYSLTKQDAEKIIDHLKQQFNI